VTDSLYINWNFGDGSVIKDNQFIVSHVFPDTGYYDVSLIAINEYGCIDTLTKTIRVRPDFALYTPNAFTPNGDGINDTFFPEGVGIDLETGNFTFLVFDRWGEVIFESNSKNVPWDGIAHKKGGKKVVQSGVYVWKIIARTIEKQELTPKDAQVVGIVTVLH
jgi:gliding motility-associated-like protein